MSIFSLIFFTGLLGLTGVSGLSTDGPLPLSHNPADFKFGRVPVEGLSAGVCIRPLPITVQVLIKNESARPAYLFQVSEQGQFHLSVLDTFGHEHPIHEVVGEPLMSHPASVIPPGGSCFGILFVQQDAAKAIGGNQVIAYADLRDKPIFGDPQAHTITVRTVPFQLCPTAPVQATLPDDPMAVQWKQREADFLDRIGKTTDPKDRSGIVAELAYFYLNTYGDFDKARALLPQITDPVDALDTRTMLITRNPSVAAKEKVLQLQALLSEAPPDRQHEIKMLISVYQYAANHPDKKSQ